MNISTNDKGKIAKRFRNEDEVKKGNRIILVKNNGTEIVESIPNVDVHWYGENSVIKIHENHSVKKLNLFVGENAYIELGENFNVRFYLSIDARGNNSSIVIGKNANFGRAEIYAGDDDDLEVIIGDNFLNALGLYIRNSDGHTIYELGSKRVINSSKFGVHIGNHVWVGYNVTILKDACIPNDCVIGAGAVVGKGDYSDNSVLAGVPAKTIRTGINWDSRSISNYLNIKE